MYRVVDEFLTCVEMELISKCSEEDMQQLFDDGTVAILRQYRAAYYYACDDENVDGNIIHCPIKYCF